MRRKQKLEDPHENQDRWLLTYADLITLLLAFFIILYSMSSIDAKQFGEMANALKETLKGSNGVVRFDPKLQAPGTGHGVLKVGDLKMLQRQVEGEFIEKNRADEVQTEVTERGLVIHVMESALFTPGSADLQPRAIGLLDMIYEQLKNMPNHIRVEGHTDNRPIANTKFPSNWELSSARATSVVRYFISNHSFPAAKISALGYGEYRPIQPNNTPEHMAQNRRVDIVVLTLELSEKEPSSSAYYQITQ
jgi:chemotaxis protein MotB